MNKDKIKQPNSLLFERLEDRILLSADPVAGLDLPDVTDTNAPLDKNEFFDKNDTLSLAPAKDNANISAGRGFSLDWQTKTDENGHYLLNIDIDSNKNVQTQTLIDAIEAEFPERNLLFEAIQSLQLAEQVNYAEETGTITGTDSNKDVVAVYRAVPLDSVTDVSPSHPNIEVPVAESESFSQYDSQNANESLENNTSANDSNVVESLISGKNRAVVFIDTQVEDYGLLLTELYQQYDHALDLDIVILDAEQDGIAQISVTLAKYENIDAVHIFSHASEANIALGNSDINASNLSDYLPMLETWSTYLSEDADLLLYGCDIAAGETGINFVKNLSLLTGADVAASDDVTGNSEQQAADWELEVATGLIESINLSVAQWQGTLAANDISGKIIKDHEGDAEITGSLDVGIEGVHVYLYKDENNNGVPDNSDVHKVTAVTDVNGNYSFSNLGSYGNGTYWLVVESGNINSLGATVEQTYGAKGALIDPDADSSTAAVARDSAGSVFGGRRMEVFDTFSSTNMDMDAAEHITKIVLDGATAHTDIDFGFGFLSGLTGGYSEFYIPGRSDLIWEMFESIDNNEELDEADGLRTFISITSSTDNTTIYYDHWEDGFDFNPLDPSSADETVTLASGGTSHNFEGQNIPVKPRGTDVYYDHGDRIYIAGGPVSATVNFWPESIGTVFANSWELYPVKPFQSTYVLPGQGLDLAGDNVSPNDLNDFEHVYGFIQATQDGTSVTVTDPNGNLLDLVYFDSATGEPVSLGTNPTLNQGQVALVGQVQDSGASNIGSALSSTHATVNANKPVQVQYVIGEFIDEASTASESRGYTAVPKNLWDDEYYSPIGGSSAVQDVDSSSPSNADLYIYNPNPNSIDIYYEDKTGTGTFTIPADATLAYSDALGRFSPHESAIYVKSTGGEKFVATGSIDSEYEDFDWGYGLVPAYLLRDEYHLGWAPGNSNADPSLDENGSPLFVTPRYDNTQIFVDLDGDGVADPYDFDNADGDDDPTTGAETSGIINRLDSLKVFDNTDNDNTGLHVWATGPIAAAWGQNMGNDAAAARLSPYMDLGYTSLPLPVEWMDVALGIIKTSNITTMMPAAGAEAEFTLAIPAYQAVDDLQATDILPAHWTYKDDSATITLPNRPSDGTYQTISGNAADPMSGSFVKDTDRTTLTWDLSNYGIDGLDPNEYIIIDFTAETPSNPADIQAGYNQNDSMVSGTRDPDGPGGADPQIFTAEDDAYVYLSPLTIDKDVDASTKTILAGEDASYIITLVNNDSANTMNNISVGDTLAVGFSYKAGSAKLDGVAIADPSISGQNLTWSSALLGGADIAANTTRVLTFDATSDANIASGVYQNDAWVDSNDTDKIFDYGQTPMDPGTPTDGSDVVDDEDVTVIAAELIAEKGIIATSETFTNAYEVAIGEIVRYRLQVQLPENDVTNLVIHDNLPDGLQFIEDSARVSFIDNDNNLTVVDADLAGAEATGVSPYRATTFDFSAAGLDDNVSSDPSSDVDTYTSGTDIYFKLGDLQNTTDKTSAEYAVIEFNALVLNEVGNQQGTILENSFSVSVDEVAISDANSNPVEVSVIEPVINIDTSIPNPPSSADTQITYQITVTNSGDMETYNLQITDQLQAANLDIDNISDIQQIGSTGDVGTVSLTNTNLGTEKVVIDIESLGANASITFSITADMSGAVGTTIDNTATVTYTSLAGDQGTASNATESSTPGNTGDADGERTGDTSHNAGAVNDYKDSDSAPTYTMPTPAPSVSKSIVSVNNLSMGTDAYDTAIQDVGVGDEITYRITLDVPKNSPAEQVTLGDLLPHEAVSLTYQSHSITIGSDLSVANTNPSPTISDTDNDGGNDSYSFDFGNVSSGSDNTDANRQIQIDIVATVSSATADPQHYWKLDESSGTNTANDEGTGTQRDIDITTDGNMDNASWLGAGKIDGALSFDGSEYVKLGSNGDIQIDKDDTFSISLWFKTTSNGTLIAKAGKDSPTNREMQMYVNGGVLIGKIGGEQVGGVGSAINDGTWHMATLVNNGTNAALYLDDGNDLIEQDTETVGAVTTTYDLLLGARSDNAGTGTEFHFTGDIDDVRIYEGKELTQAEVAKLYNLNALSYEPKFANTASYNNGSTTTKATVDAEVIETASVGNYAWLDSNEDGVQNEAADKGLNGITVKIYKDNGDGSIDTTTDTLVKTTTTADDGSSNPGYYQFDQLAPGKYFLQFENSDYLPSPNQDAGGNDATDSDINNNGLTGFFTLNGGGDLTTQDAGFLYNNSLGDKVWQDSDGDGEQDAGEDDVNGVVVELRKDSDNSLVKTTTTAGGGLYNFSNIAPGDYYIQVTAPTGNTFTTKDAATIAETADSDVDSTSGKTDTITVAANTSSNDYDAGLLFDTQIGDKIWYDADGDGEQDATEEGIKDVTVQLLKNSDGSVVATTTTANDGSYQFDNVPADTYRLKFVKPTDTSFTTQDNIADDAKDSDANTTSGETAAFSVSDGDTITHLDAGLKYDNSLGNLVWEDLNQDGIQDTGEDGIENVTVKLLASNGTTEIATTNTDSDGLYSFTNLKPGDYIVQVTAPTGTLISPQNAGSDDAKDSDVDTTTGKTAAITVAAGTTDDSIDAGIKYAGISNLVWHDANADGIQDAGELPIQGVTVKLYDSLGTTLKDTQVTDVNGEYQFEGLAAGDYIVEIIKPTGASLTTQGAGADSSKDSDFDNATSRTAAVTLTAGQLRTDIDAGLTYANSLGDKVWYDADGDGEQNASEVGLNGVTVDLMDSTGTTVIKTDTTSGDGDYSFTNLKPADYVVRITKPADTSFTSKDNIADDSKDSDVDTSTGKTAAVTMAGDTTDSSVDAGLKYNNSLGDKVWQDTDGDGEQDGSEAGVDNVKVELRKADDNSLVKTTTTAGGGLYNFSNIAPGDYYIQVTAPTGNTFTSKDSVADTIDSDVDSTSGKTDTITVAANTSSNDYDAGLLFDTQIGDKVWYDADGDGEQDGTEEGIDGVTVQLLKNSDNSVVATEITASGGLYQFDNVPADTYRLKFVKPTDTSFTTQDNIADDAKDSDANTTSGETAAFSVNDGDTITNLDAGLKYDNSLGNLIWQDLNQDGIQDPGEDGIENVTVKLLASNGTTEIATTNTDSNGLYSFTNLKPGDYIVQVTAPTGTLISPQNAGSDDAKDSDVDTTTGKTAAITVAAGTTDNSIDAGIKYAGISNLVWHDANADGIQDGGELPIQGVTVKLYDSLGTTLKDTQVTDVNGEYQFEGLAAGDYIVEVTKPTGASLTTQGAGADTDKDSDFDNATSRTAAVTLTAGQLRSDIDAGLTYANSLGDKVWYDADGDGEQGASEVGLNGVTVELMDSTGTTVIKTDTTSGDGDYSFTNLKPADYVVRVTKPADTSFTSKDNIADDSKDSDVDTTTGKTTAVTMAGDTSNTSVDAGLKYNNSLGDKVWQDSDGDGEQDAGEDGVDNVTVELRKAVDDSLVKTTTTSGGGLYNFNNIAPGDYYIQVIKPAGQLFTSKDSVADTIDSDVDSSTGKTDTITVAANDNETDIDIGLKLNTRIGDLVWLDSNHNGFKDATESGLDGVSVNLYLDQNNDGVLDAGDTKVGDTSTVNGAYEFSELNPGKYIVEVIPPINMKVTTGGDIHVTTLTAGQNYTLADFGYAPPKSTTNSDIGDLVWYDTNGDGIKDAGEPVIPNVKLNLIGTSTPTQTTDANGLYQFDKLSAGSFFVQVDENSLPFAMELTTPNLGNHRSLRVELPADTSIDTVDFGYRGTGSLGNLVWLDENADGLQDSTESGIAGVPVELTWAGFDNDFNTLDDNIVFSTTTDSSGKYLFEHLPAGEFKLTVDANSSALQGLSQTAGKTDMSLSAGQQRDDGDFGFNTSASGSIGDRVWFDSNQDGVQDASELDAVAGLNVTLLGAGADGDFNTSADNIQITTTTDSNGLYQFDGLSTGSHQISIDPQNLATGQNLTTNALHALDLSAGEQYLDADFGIATTALTSAIGDTVWLDSNADGLQYAGESGAENIAVQLDFAGADGVFGTADDSQQTTTTDAQGQYRFDNLPSGTYQVSLVASTLPSGVSISSAKNMFELDLATNSERLDIDFGLAQPTGAIGDFVWLDSDADGQQDANESGIAGVTVILRDAGNDGVLNTADDVLSSTVTDAQGQYQFAGLSAGTYQLHLDSNSLPTPLNLSTQNQDTQLVLANGEQRQDLDFGLVNSTIGDFVWLDSDADGQQDANESGIAGVTVTLRAAGKDGVLNSADDVLSSTVTDAQGHYQFENLSSGQYQVTIAPEANQMLTTPAQYDLDLTATPIDSADFGLTQPHRIGDKVWFDSNADGIEDANETGVEAITVNLRGAGKDGVLGTADDLIASTKTDSNGVYQFAQLPASDYIVYLSSMANQDFSTPQQFNLTLAEGKDRLDADFGLIDAGSIGDRVWLDSDADGQQDDDEQGVAGVKVNLQAAGADGILDTADDVFKETTTDSLGLYRFEHLSPDNYRVTIDTTETLSTADNIVTQLGMGEDYNKADFGLLPALGSIGDHVWFDSNGNGLQEAGEQGAAGVSVNLRAAGSDGVLGTDDDVLQQTQTDSKGQYRFDALPEGLYSVEIDTQQSLTTPEKQTLNLQAGESNLDMDFGLSSLSSIGDRVWFDSDADGVQDADEQGQAGVLVQLRYAGSDGILGSSDDVSEQMRTDAQGLYQFNDLIAGKYQVSVVSDLLITTASEQIINLQSDERLDNIDFGLSATQGQIGDLVWFDADGDGVQDSDELGISDVTVTLSSAGDDGIEGTADDIQKITVTDSQGHYRFDNLPEADYRIQIDSDSIPPSLQANTTELSLHLGSNEQNHEMDFALESLSSQGRIGDLVWKDDNLDGLQNEDNLGSHGIRLTLTEAGEDGLFDTDDDVIQTTETDNQGRYEFVRLTQGEYRLDLDSDTLPEGYQLQSDKQQQFNLGKDEVRDDFDFRLTPESIEPKPELEPTGKPDYQVSKDDGVDKVRPGQQLTYQISVSNHGQASGHDVRVIDKFPADILEIISVSDGGVVNGERITWTLDSLAVNQSKILIVKAEVKADANADSFSNLVSVTDKQGNDSRLEDNTDADDNRIIPVADDEGDQDTDGETEGQTPDTGEQTPDDEGQTPDGEGQTPEGEIPPSNISGINITPEIERIDSRFVFNTVEQDRGFVSSTDLKKAKNEQYGFYWPNGDIQFDLPPLPISPVFSGSVAPGTTMTVIMFDDHGSEVGTQTVMADTGGNWLASFPNTILWKAPHSIQIKQQVALYNQDEMSVYDMRTYFTPAITSQLFVSTPVSVQTVMAHSPIKMIQALHRAFEKPLALNWDDFSSYQFQASSSTTTQSSM